ncbi:MAG: hypothetical protein A3J38_01130 [Gammaproteobacteria bacterium RIFCSPHIGHO2_12_FULL_45_9]|nr:MAG: hypothetical protein A3J38_01130 [Gammaproteobacteria bacterium RIFCSPHIGHO2_12_FULL_45_9]
MNRFPSGKRFSYLVRARYFSAKGFILFEVLLAGTLCILLFLPMWFLVLQSRAAVLHGFYEMTALFSAQSVLERFRVNQMAPRRLLEVQMAAQEVARLLPSGTVSGSCTSEAVCTVDIVWQERTQVQIFHFVSRMTQE